MSPVARRSISWAEEVWGRPVRDVRRLSGGWTSTILGLTARDGERAVLRLMTKEPWRTHAAQLLGRESEVQGQLVGTKVPAPRSLAVDPVGACAGSPAHLMTWLPGSLELTRADEGLLRRLARLLVDIHDHDPGSAVPRTYQSWATPSKRVVPEWAQRPEVWKQAFEELEQPPPAYRGTFLHRDFHLGNVLWDRGEVTGVVDWVETSWGPAGLDVAHTATYLAMLHGVDAADRFTSAYGDLSGEHPGGRDQRYWDVMDVVGYLPDPAKVVQPWRDVGREVSDQVARSRLEQRLATLLQR